MTVKEVVSFQVGLKKRKKEARGNGRWYGVKEEESRYLPLFQQVNTSIGSSIFCLE